MLHELRLWCFIQIIGELVRVKPWRLIELECISVKSIRAGSGDHSDLGSAVAPVLGRAIAGDDPELGEGVRVGPGWREIRASRAWIVIVYSVEREIPGSISRSMNVNPASCVRPVDD